MNTVPQLTGHRHNPYVGPRAIRNGERLPARKRERRELTDLLISERIVLLHSPSGAGKTSLIQAGITPLLLEEGFAPTLPLRVNTPTPHDVGVRNRYVYSAGLGMLGDGGEPDEVGPLSLSELLKEMPTPRDRIPVLVFDQFEEILTLDPTDREGQREFFYQLGTALTDPRSKVWALLSMREDYMGGLDRFVRYLPSHLRTTYRLDFLDLRGARQAIQGLASEQGVAFEDEGVDELLDKLRTVEIQRPGNDTSERIQAPYIEPFQLQVTCRKLWKTVRREKGDDFRTIDLSDVKRSADVAGALGGYYADTVSEVARTTHAEESAIREWFESELITDQHFRSQTLSGPISEGVDPKTILAALVDAYLVRGDQRADSIWYELTHDQLIEPVLANNAIWRRARLKPWQLAARQWSSTREAGLLLRGRELHSVSDRKTTALTEAERAFLHESERAEHERGLLDRTRSALSWVVVVALVEALVIVLLIIRSIIS
jgi:hypothetical protein